MLSIYLKAHQSKNNRIKNSIYFCFIVVFVVAKKQYAKTMQKHKGFTIVELTIAMVVMVILLGVGVVGLRSVQLKAKDRERQSDAQAIAAYMEQLYAKEIRDGSNNVIKKAGSYPSTVLWSNTTYKDIVFADIDRNITYAPDVTGSVPSLRPATSGSSPTTPSARWGT
jgi:prepilin-type N-terminal cleavage/methylation domain-containing protein